jgi:ubiquinone/menaquinone biosynthesis C-methylase UbiE
VDDARHTEQTRRFFDTAAAGWTTRYARDAVVAARKARFLESAHARITPPADILDFGCGSGDITLHLAEAGYRLTGFDLSSAMIDQAQLSDIANHVLWTAHHTGGSMIPYDDETFDAIVASSVLEYVPALDATLNEFARMLRSGGWLFATVPDMRDPHRAHERWLRFALALPGIARIMERSRWREGAAYLRISSNRMSAPVWQARLTACGLAPQPVPDPSGPLLMLTAQKIG